MANNYEISATSKAINERILGEAISLLRSLDLGTAESVQINHSTYDDGSALLEVGVAFPAEVTEDKPTLDELVAKVTEDNRHDVVGDIQRSYE